MNTEAQNFKLRKIMPSNMPEELESMSDEELEKRIVECAHNRKEAVDAMLNNEKLKLLKDEIKEVRRPFKDAIKCQDAIRDYALDLLEKRGKA